MSLFLHTPSSHTSLTDIYLRAFSDATELYVVSAYLTDWNEKLLLGKNLSTFRIIIGKDFGITRKEACRKVLTWLPPSRKAQFLVADNILGFHPKAVFWQVPSGISYALVGSSNLTRAAFEKNFEANLFSEISSEDFQRIKSWIEDIENKSVVVSEDWITQYVEGKSVVKKGDSPPPRSIPTIPLRLKVPPDSAKLLERRRNHLLRYRETQKELIDLFRKCAKGKITSENFFEQLPSFWDGRLGNRLQGKGYERRGKSADFHELANSFLKIYDSNRRVRDDVTSFELDQLATSGNPARRAFLSEMLCLAFPSDYPVLNKPVTEFIKANKFRAPKGATEGARYIDLAKKLRAFLQQNPDYPAKTLAELDTLIWRVHGKEA